MTTVKLVVNLFVILNILSPSELNQRQSRFSLMPSKDPTELQFIVGFGVPVDLEDEQVVTGYAIQMRCLIPYEIDHFYPAYFSFEDRNRNRRATVITNDSAVSELKSVRNIKSFEAKQNVQYDTEINYSRWRIYRVIEGVLNHRELQGRQCLLRAICELSVMRITHESGLLGELINIILTPSSSSELTESSDQHEYYAAERLGLRKNEQICAQIYGICETSLLELFSEILDVMS